MASEKTTVFGTIAAVVVGFVALILIWLANGQSPEINNFDDCVAAGNPVLESFPEQCVTENGRSFTRDSANLEY